MKKIILLTTIALLTLTSFKVKEEENKGIQFFEGTYTEALAKAKKENKLVFLDAYTSWCHYCKKMSAYVFSKPKVGEYFNENFINVKMNMEKGEGPALGKKLGVRAYPTLIFLDGDGIVKYNHEGYLPSDDFLKLGMQLVKKNK